VVRGRRVDLQALIKARFDVDRHARSVGKVLRRLGCVRLSVRPKHPSSQPEAQETFKKLRSIGAGGAARARGRPTARDRVHRWWNAPRSTASVSRAPRPGSGRAAAPAPGHRARRAAWASRFGAVGPLIRRADHPTRRAAGAGRVLPCADPAARRRHRQAIGRQVTPGAHAVLALDGVGGHGLAALGEVPRNLTLLPRPPSAPELDPVANLWPYLRQNPLRLRVWPDDPVIVATCCQAWNALMAMPERIASITRREWAKPVTG
jgi:putative transposase